MTIRISIAIVRANRVTLRKINIDHTGAQHRSRDLVPDHVRETVTKTAKKGEIGKIENERGTGTEIPGETESIKRRETVIGKSQSINVMITMKRKK